MFKKFSSYLPQIIAMLFLAGFVAYAWTEPASAPPGGNVAAPVNISGNSQTFVNNKILNVRSLGDGILLLNGFLNVTRDAIFDGKVGIGTTNPQGLLDVGGESLVVTKEPSYGPLQESGWYNPNSVSVDTSFGSKGFTNPGNARISDNNRALTYSDNLEAFSYYLKATGFNINIPAGAKINGIKVEVEGFYETYWGSGANIGNVRLVKNGVISGLSRGPSGLPLNSANENYVSLGGSNDMWGETWTNTDINSSNFGVAVSARLFPGYDEGNGVTTPGSAYIDSIRIKVFYSFPSGGTAGVLRVGNATITGDDSAGSNFSISKDGLILKSYTGFNCYLIRVDGAGALSTLSAVCP